MAVSDPLYANLLPELLLSLVGSTGDVFVAGGQAHIQLAPAVDWVSPADRCAAAAAAGLLGAGGQPASTLPHDLLHRAPLAGRCSTRCAGWARCTPTSAPAWRRRRAATPSTRAPWPTAWLVGGLVCLEAPLCAHCMRFFTGADQVFQEAKARRPPWTTRLLAP